MMMRGTCGRRRGTEEREMERGRERYLVNITMQDPTQTFDKVELFWDNRKVTLTDYKDHEAEKLGLST